MTMDKGRAGLKAGPTHAGGSQDTAQLAPFSRPPLGLFDIIRADGNVE